MIKRVGKRGDTLIEVTLAVGIFSMIAVAVTAVMSSGTSGAQTALETTLTREEIDTQAEAIRFIQTAYAADKDAADKRFVNLWQAIIDKAIKLNTLQESTQEEILQYAPSSCQNLYDNPRIAEAAFVINPRRLGNFTADKNDKNNGVGSVFVSRQNNNASKFIPASTYPHLVFGVGFDSNEDAENTSLIDGATYDNLFRAEGIYVIAVKDSANSSEKGTTSIVKENRVDKVSAFYDFYIRTCWYGTDAEQPSTISTVIRLHDPDAMNPNDY